MAWKQDLAKLKQQLGPEAAAPLAKFRPKPLPKPDVPAALEDEDDIFLSAMGQRSPTPRPIRPATPEAPSPASSAAVPTAPESFEQALKDLKGLKPMGKGLPESRSAQRPANPSAAEPSAVLLPASHQEATPATEIPTPQTTLPPPLPIQAVTVSPVRFQLAAGMAIEVDGCLDVRGHSLADAMDRLQDRLGDGQVLGWRSLQVTLGADPALHDGLMALLASGQAPMVVRYAQAPVPMGGTQAWLLYFGLPPIQP